MLSRRDFDLREPDDFKRQGAFGPARLTHGMLLERKAAGASASLVSNPKP